MSATAIIRAGLREVRVAFTPPQRLNALLKQGGLSVDQPCGGRGKCGKCRVRAAGALRPAEPSELAKLTDADRDGGIRLACMAVAEGDVEITLLDVSSEKIMTGFALPDLKGQAWGEGLGLAVDIGTTTLAAYLYDLDCAQLLAVESCPNPQRAFGADVTSRLKASMEGEREALQARITDALSQMTQALLDRAGRKGEPLHCAVVTGNTAMLYLLTGREVSSIAFAPFEPSTRFGDFVDASAIGLPAPTQVYLPRCSAAYVGADITCAMLYAGFLSNESPCGAPRLLVDIGTNGEMALCAGGHIYTCSTAAGPAFEGAGIRYGMTARDGAICRASFDGQRMQWQSLGGRATGICGSGLVDAIAALLDAGALDDSGCLQVSGHALEACMTELDGQPAFRFEGSDVFLTQADVRAVQLAKAAICAGILVLLDAAGVAVEDVAALELAGGFGSCIRPETAARIGLIPESLASRAHVLGNAAGAGASMMLLSRRCLQADALVDSRCTTIELSSNADFSDAFVDCMGFE